MLQIALTGEAAVFACGLLCCFSVRRSILLYSCDSFRIDLLGARVFGAARLIVLLRITFTHLSSHLGAGEAHSE